MSGFRGATTTAPSAPRNAASVAGVNEYTISWDAPLSSGGSAITGYNVYIAGVLFGSAGLSLSTVLSHGDCPPGSQVYITAVNSAGESVNSNVVNTQNVPSAPTNLSLTIDGTDVIVDWDAPVSDGGATITNYKIYVDAVMLYDVGQDLSYTLTQAECPDGAEVWITATNIVGEGAASDSAICDIPFGPPALTGLQADIDPGTTATVTLVSGAISQVNDISGNARHATQGTAGSRGTIRTAELNGWDVMYFASGKSIVVPSSVLATWDTANAGSLYLVTKYRTNNNYVNLIDTPGRHFSIFAQASTGYMQYSQLGAGNAGSSTLNQLVKDAWSIIAVVTPASGNSNTDMFINGTYIGNKISGGATYTEAITLGANPSGGGVIPDGDYARLIVYNSVHTTNERQKVEGYLAHRFGLTGSLPGDHPYKSTPP